MKKGRRFRTDPLIAPIPDLPPGMQRHLSDVPVLYQISVTLSSSGPKKRHAANSVENPDSRSLVN
jgi:hypothetical protein